MTLDQIYATDDRWKLIIFPNNANLRRDSTVAYFFYLKKACRAHGARLPKNLVQAVRRVHYAGIRGLTLNFQGGGATVVAEDKMIYFNPAKKYNFITSYIS